MPEIKINYNIYTTQRNHRAIVSLGRFALSTESVFKFKEVGMFFTKSDFKGYCTKKKKKEKKEFWHIFFLLLF